MSAAGGFEFDAGQKMLALATTDLFVIGPGGTVNLMAELERFCCPYCGHSALLLGKPASEDVVRCDECGTTYSYGVMQPRVVVEPHPDKRFVTLLIERIEPGCVGTDAKTSTKAVCLKLDADFARAIAKNLASIA